VTPASGLLDEDAATPLEAGLLRMARMRRFILESAVEERMGGASWVM
jgi:hypothetical protein